MIGFDSYDYEWCDTFVISMLMIFLYLQITFFWK